MMSNNNKHVEMERHREVWELLPWYVNGTLNDREGETVGQHISECQTCEAELTQCRTIAAAIRSSEVAAWTPSADRMARRMARIDREGGFTDAERSRFRLSSEHATIRALERRMPLDEESVSTKAGRRRFRLRKWIEKSRVAFQGTPSPFHWVLAAQTAVIILLIAASILPTWIAPSAPYRTLSDSVRDAEADPVHIRVIFADDITERELRVLLGTLGATMVAGPSAMAVYTLAVPVSDSERTERMRSALETLRAHPKVRLAEPKAP